MSGTYVLVIDVTESVTVEVGALGDREFSAGTYAYVGSAFGPGGFSRVDRRRSKAPTRSPSLCSRDRHRELAAGDRDAHRRSFAPTRSHSLRSRDRHWHVDYLLGHPATRLERAITFPGADRECELADSLPGDLVPEFGASDCDCETHLLASPTADAVLEAAVDAGVVDG